MGGGAGAGVGSQGWGWGPGAGAGNCEGARLPPPGRAWPLHGGDTLGVGGGMGLHSDPTMELCVPAAEGRGRRPQAHRPTFPCFALSWPDAWVLGAGEGGSSRLRAPEEMTGGQHS